MCKLMRASNFFMLEFLMSESQNLEVDKFLYADKMDTRNCLFTGTVARARKKTTSGSPGQVAVN